MKITNLQLSGYRNYAELTLQLSPNLNIFIGDNAQGKTNIIEAIHYAALGISHRTRTDAELINWKFSTAHINLLFTRRNLEHKLQFTLPQNARKQINLNGETIKQKELPGVLTMILFSPEDLMLIKGAPQLRRRFLDIELSQISSLYYNDLVVYNKLLQQRNNLLKQLRERPEQSNLLDMWDLQLANVAAAIVHKRRQGVEKLNAITATTHRWLSNELEALQLTYEVHRSDSKFVAAQSVSELSEWYAHKLAQQRQHDIYRGSTGVGPHRDDLDLAINDVSLKSFGSQGQQRSAVLSLKLAELEFLEQETGEYPILLLDDVMSELDHNRRERLLSWLATKNIQTLITATDRSLFTLGQKEQFFKVTNGCVEEGTDG